MLRAEKSYLNYLCFSIYSVCASWDYSSEINRWYSMYICKFVFCALGHLTNQPQIVLNYSFDFFTYKHTMHGSAKWRTIFFIMNHSEPSWGWKKSTTLSIASIFGWLWIPQRSLMFFLSFSGAIEFYCWHCTYLSPRKNHATGLTAGLKECYFDLLNLRRELWKLTMYKCCVYFAWEKAGEMTCILMRRHYQDVDTY